MLAAYKLTSVVKEMNWGVCVCTCVYECECFLANHNNQRYNNRNTFVTCQIVALMLRGFASLVSLINSLRSVYCALFFCYLKHGNKFMKKIIAKSYRLYLKLCITAFTVARSQSGSLVFSVPA